MTTPSTTSGKSWPLATIWVPTRTPDSAAWKRSRISRWPPARAPVSASRRKTGSGAAALAISSSIRWLPAPARASVTEPQSGQAEGSRSAWPQ